MKILIGTPIHVSKDYAMERWLENVAMLEYPADIFLAGNSPTPTYAEKVRKYCEKYRIPTVNDLAMPVSDQGKNCKIEYWGHFTNDLQAQHRISFCEEVIRRKVLVKNYDAWFSWECDQIIPPNALDALVKLMEDTGTSMVVHNSWARDSTDQFNLDMGVTLIKRDVLEEFGFWSRNYQYWKGGLSWYKERVFRGGGNYVDAYGVIDPIYHLDNPS